MAGEVGCVDMGPPGLRFSHRLATGEGPVGRCGWSGGPDGVIFGDCLGCCQGKSLVSWMELCAGSTAVRSKCPAKCIFRVRRRVVNMAA